MKKLCFIVQRYGLEVNGGAELHCRQLAEHMKSRFDVSVLTTKAIDYMTWKDEYLQDREEINGVHVLRFPVKHPRNMDEFNRINGQFLHEGKIVNTDRELEWIEKQGPYVPALIDYLKQHRDDYDVFVFFTYLYYTTVIGINEVADKAIVIPTAHDEPFLRLRPYRNVFTKPRGIFYNTSEERSLIESRFGNQEIPNDLGGVGVELPKVIDAERFRKKYGLDHYMIYVGRIDEAKNCFTLFKYFEEYKKRNQNNLKLVLMGKNVIPVPEHKDIVNLGFVSDEDKFDGIAGSEFLILPSHFESLSMVVLEAMSLKKPVLVNETCEVLKGHCLKSNAGLYFKDYYDFEGTVNYLISHDDVGKAMGENGVRYVQENYQWDVIIKKLERLIDTVIGMDAL